MSNTNGSEWRKTCNCFPNDRIIPLNVIAYLRLFQNLIVVVCFTTIFILYALICVRVTQRRQLKADRDKYYKELLSRSTRNTNKHVMVAASPVKPSNDFEYKFKRNSMMSNQLPTDLSDSLLVATATTTATANSNNTDLKSCSSLTVDDQETCLNAENTKSTQTVKSAFPHIKK